ncbi:MAG: TlpA family protein disulfide reductase [Candidatus Rokuibacteriota bacterium]
MTRTRAVAVLGLVFLLGLLGVWLLGGPIQAPGPAPRSAALPENGSTAATLDGLMGELQIIPLAGRPAPAFALETLDGARLGLADLAGRPAFLYFWATW